MPGDGGRLVWPRGFARGRTNREAVVVLAALQGLTPRNLLAAAQRERTAAACLAAVLGGRLGSDADRGFASSTRPEEIESEIARCDARTVMVGDAEYPPRLAQLADPPAVVFVRGRPLGEITEAVAVVGARTCSLLGRDLATAFGRALSASGAWVVSGAARGIDSAAHEGALQRGGRTVAVLGSGVDVAYPPTSRTLIARIAEVGSVVSEYPPGTPAQPYRFPARNRIVAALATAIVVVEGAAGSGSLITAEHALDLGRDVYAVPGAVTNPLAQAPLGLIRDGAGLIRGVDDLLHDLGLRSGDTARSLEGLSEIERRTLAHVTDRVLPETVARAMRCSITDVVPVLMRLEMKGLVRSVGGRFEQMLPAPL